MPNGEKHERKWLVYSTNLDKVFCFYGKLFNVVCYTSKLAKEGRDWRNFSVKLKNNVIIDEHIINVNAGLIWKWDCQQIKTIDKYVQEQIIEIENGEKCC